jgi:hypothetical protein
MTAQSLLSQLQSKGVQFVREDEDFRILAPRGLLTRELLDQLSEHKPEIIALLISVESQLSLSHVAGLCPHCNQELQVYTQALDDEVWIQCPTKTDLFKVLKHQTDQWCRDCGERLARVAGRCAECIQRLMLAPDAPCRNCGNTRFWRNLANRIKPAGFAWHCANCKAPAGKIAIYQLTIESKGGIESLCQQQGL